MTNDDVMKAAAKLKDISTAYEYVHVVRGSGSRTVGSGIRQTGRADGAIPETGLFCPRSL